jgi:hypothetical protein
MGVQAAGSGIPELTRLPLLERAPRKIRYQFGCNQLMNMRASFQKRL